MTSAGSSTIASSARAAAMAAAGRGGSARVQPKNTARIHSAKSNPSLDLVGITPSVSKSVEFLFFICLFLKYYLISFCF